MAKILFVEDNQQLVEEIVDWMAMKHHKVDVAATGTEALEFLRSFEYDLVVLDWELPHLSGLDVLKNFRGQNGNAPVLMLTGRGAIEEKESAFAAGADDYLTKPFNPRELNIRLDALLRRPPLQASDHLHWRDAVLDISACRLMKDGRDVNLRPMEASVLQFFMRHPNEIFSPDVLLRRLWSSDQDVSIDAIYACIARVRRKLEQAGCPEMIETVHGVGYRLGSS